MPTSKKNILALKPYRRKLRSQMTRAEVVLWTMIRDKQLEGVRFLRQYSICNYIVDFYAPKYKLAIELDGEGHLQEDQLEYDTLRTEKLKELGVTVLRFENFEVLDFPERTLLEIAKHLH
jgi:very-short-patch-repair endonuclease